MINSKSTNFLSLSFILILPLLVTGPFLADLIFTTCAIYFIILLITNKELTYLKKPFFLLFLIFIISIIISSILSNNLKSIVSSFGYLRFLFFIYFTIFIINNSKKNLFLFIFYALTFTYIYLSFELLCQLYIKQTLLGNLVTNPERLIISSFYHEEIFSSYIVRTLPFYFGLFFFNRNKLSLVSKFIFFGLVIILTFSVLFNGERSAIGLLIISIIFLFMFLEISKKIKAKLIFATLILTIFVFVSLPANNLERKINGINDFKVSILDIFNQEKNNVIISEKYNSMYRTAYNLYKQNLIIGIGIKNFRVECSNKKFAFDNKSCSTHPHNLALQLLAETGLVGFFFYIFIIYLLLKTLVKNITNRLISKNHKNYVTCLICCFLVSLWPFFPSGNFFNNWLSVITFYPAGFLINETIKERRKKQNNIYNTFI